MFGSINISTKKKKSNGYRPGLQALFFFLNVEIIQCIKNQS